MRLGHVLVGRNIVHFTGARNNIFHMLCVCVHRTLLVQDTSVNVHGIPMTSYIESLVEGSCTNNSQKVRTGAGDRRDHCTHILSSKVVEVSLWKYFPCDTSEGFTVVHLYSV